MPTTAPPPTGGISRLVESARGAMDVIYREMIKFGVVGLLAFVIDLGLANLLWHTVLSDKVTTAKIISGAVATLFAWVGNRQWTFRHRRSRPPTTRSLLFFGVNAIALGISAITLYRLALRAGLHLDPRRQRRDDHRHRARHAVPVLGLPPVRLRRRAALTARPPTSAACPSVGAWCTS